MSFLTIILGTLISEDLTCIAVGLLINQGQLQWWIGLTGCYLGILVGDLGLWLIGRLLGRRILQHRWLAKKLPAHRRESLRHWFERRGIYAVLLARFIPGMRFPVYLSAGAVGPGARHFLIWAALAGVLWSPLLVGLVAWLGEPVVQTLEQLVGPGWAALLMAALLLLLLVRVVEMSLSELGRARLIAGVSRIWRWEFWPSWLMYLPLVPWIGWLSLRYRGFRTITCANPLMLHGGIAGESKWDILQHLPTEWIVPSAFLPAGPLDERLTHVRQIIAERGWNFPLIFKPDQAERGAGLRLIREEAQIQPYLEMITIPVLLQIYHPGPGEAGVFYYRLPGEPTGHIFSITAKHFPVLIGDGRSTVEMLIWRHPRFRMQAAKFLARQEEQADRVLAVGEELPLAVAGNHCQGTMFCDGAYLVTPALERIIDEIAGSCAGFYFGRFDVRFRDEEAFKTGRDFQILELNGISSESTNIYDPARGLWAAYHTLYRQWALLFRIGAALRTQGQLPATWSEIIRTLHHHYRIRKVPDLAD
ncbi:MAG: hypothetical protein HJJLKODD_02024 [Phycisphaerae bacterium]|nr:hypothetical protein [Phycisphaerae bacterium]